MSVVRAVKGASGDNPTRRLYDRIGTFLIDQRLEPDPANYAFAYQLLADPDGPLARAVEALTDGGVRLTERDIATLGCEARPINAKAIAQRADGLVAQTQMQVEGFEDMVSAIRVETQGFGRDLAASAEQMSHSASGDLSEVVQLTATMLERVRSAEERLESATREASELRKKLEEARDNARRDPLTDLPNRRAFEEAYAAQTATGAALCIAICDVDHFKQVNDRFGHAVGDRVLKAIAAALSETCKGHLVARYGGEEFAVLFSGIDLAAARSTLDTARATVATKHYRLREDEMPVGEITFSAGLTESRGEDSFQTALHRADKLLYSAKSDGRNCLRAG